MGFNHPKVRFQKLVSLCASRWIQSICYLGEECRKPFGSCNMIFPLSWPECGGVSGEGFSEQKVYIEKVAVGEGERFPNFGQVGHKRFAIITKERTFRNKVLQISGITITERTIRGTRFFESSAVVLRRKMNSGEYLQQRGPAPPV